ncbi:MAG TPA: hypothetical protein VEK82_00940 [Stellaceae bacterium]|nr:hypothetical protein [Stellaceae bacterium]
MAAALVCSITSQSTAVICPNGSIYGLMTEVLTKYYGSREAATIVLSDPKYLKEATEVVSHFSCTALPQGTKMEVKWDEDAILPIVTSRLPDGTEVRGVTTEIEYTPPRIWGEPCR